MLFSRFNVYNTVFLYIPCLEDRNRAELRSLYRYRRSQQNPPSRQSNPYNYRPPSRDPPSWTLFSIDCSRAAKTLVLKNGFIKLIKEISHRWYFLCKYFRDRGHNRRYLKGRHSLRCSQEIACASRFTKSCNICNCAINWQIFTAQRVIIKKIFAQFI